MSLCNFIIIDIPIMSLNINIRITTEYYIVYNLVILPLQKTFYIKLVIFPLQKNIIY